MNQKLNILSLLERVLRGGFDGEYVVSERSLELTLEIQRVLSPLETVGDDEVKCLCVDARRGKEVRWFWISTGVYRDLRWVKITDMDHEYASFENKERSNVAHHYDMTWFLEPFLEFVKAKMAELVASPEEYNAKIEAGLPYRQRRGRISQKKLYEILPERRIEVKDKVRSIDALYKAIDFQRKFENGTTEGLFDRMTIGIFCKYFRIANELMFKEKHDKKLSDKEYYLRHKHISGLDEYDFDSEADFKELAKDHFYSELGFSRLHISPVKNDAGQWAISASVSYSAYVDTYADICAALHKAGAPLVAYDANKVLEILEERDYVLLTPHIFHDYLDHHKEGSVMSLPYPQHCGRGEITKRQLQKIIDATEWIPLEPMRLESLVPLDDDVYSLIRDEAIEPMTMHQIAQAIQKKCDVYMSIHFHNECTQHGYSYIFSQRNDDRHSRWHDSKQVFETYNDALRACIQAYMDFRKNGHQ